jgi:hypothetical protein
MTMAAAAVRTRLAREFLFVERVGEGDALLVRPSREQEVLPQELHALLDLGEVDRLRAAARR